MKAILTVNTIKEAENTLDRLSEITPYLGNGAVFDPDLNSWVDPNDSEYVQNLINQGKLKLR